MKIAVTYDDGKIFQHFGRTEQFKVYEVEDGKILKGEVVDTNGIGHGALAQLLYGMGVETLICGGIGGGAQSALAQAGINVYGGVTGDADAAVENLIAGNLAYDADIQCDHHGSGHACGGHQHGCASGGTGCH